MVIPELLGLYSRHHNHTKIPHFSKCFTYIPLRYSSAFCMVRMLADYTLAGRQVGRSWGNGPPSAAPHNSCSVTFSLGFFGQLFLIIQSSEAVVSLPLASCRSILFPRIYGVNHYIILSLCFYTRPHLILVNNYYMPGTKKV